jgi:SAM-dependent methyltransferase
MRSTTASRAIPDTCQSPRILDLGVGTGLKLERLLERFPAARITGVAVSQRMLAELAAKRRPWSGLIRRIQGSFLDVEFGNAPYDAAVPVMALHHGPPSVKRTLYQPVTTIDIGSPSTCRSPVRPSSDCSGRADSISHEPYSGGPTARASSHPPFGDEAQR